MSARLPSVSRSTKVKVIGALVILPFLVWLLFTAINRGPNDAYVLLVALAIAGVLLVLMAAVFGRGRRR